MIYRRQLLRGGVCVLGAPFLNRGRFSAFANGPRDYSAATLALVRSSTVIDMLGLLTLDYRKLMTWQTLAAAFHDTDLQRLKDSGITVFHPAVGFVTGDVYTSSVKDLTNWNLFLATHADQFIRVDNVSDAERAKQSGKIGIILGLQNSQHFRTVEDIGFFYNLGQRISQLTYYDNKLGGGSMDPDRGLSDFGAQVIARMNELGMAVDVSHCADRTTLDTVEQSTKPVLVTHSNCRALVLNNPRCKTDEAIRKIAAKGGVFGVTMVRPFVRAQGRTTIEDVLDHIDHVASVAGVESVGLGTDVDQDGRESGPVRTSDLDGLAYPRKIFDLAEGLLRRKYKRADIELILGGNFQRALATIWKK